MHERPRRAVLHAGLAGAAAFLLPAGLPFPRPSIVQAAPAGAWSGWEAFIAVVWPQDGHGNGTTVAQSRAVNIAVWPRNPVHCAYNPTQDPSGTTQFQLWSAKNSDVAAVVASQGALVQRTRNGVTFPMVEFDNIPADLVADPTAQYRFTIGLTWYGNSLFGSNVWVHALDARTYAPQPVVPAGIQPTAGPVDARIQIVWPHDGQGRYAPPDQATFVNVAVDLFPHGTSNAVPLDYALAPSLLIAQGNAPLAGSSLRPQKVSYTVNGQAVPRWVFNDVPVRPGQQYHFAVFTATGPNGAVGFTNVWTHAADARTYLPTPQPPPACRP